MIRAERLIAFAIISRYEKNDLKIDGMTSKYGEIKHKETLSYSSHGTLMTHTMIGLAALLQVEHI